jgi:hypothetical protein
MTYAEVRDEELDPYLVTLLIEEVLQYHHIEDTTEPSARRYGVGRGLTRRRCPAPH